MDLIFRKCDMNDLETLQDIAYNTYKDTFGAMNTVPTMNAYLEKAFDINRLKEEMSNSDSFFYFLYNNKLLVGYIKVNLPKAQSDLYEIGSLELERIYVKKEHKGNGYGKYLMNKTINIAKENECKNLWLGVWEKNEAAMIFYRKMGFEVFSQHTFSMGDELQNDLMFKKQL